MMVRRALQQRPVDLIYVNGPRVLPAAIQPHAPVVFHAHSIVGAGWARAIAGWSLRRARATALACSEFAARPVEAATGRQVEIVYNGVTDCGFGPRVAGRGPVCVGLLGRIAPEKGHLDFIDAARRLSGNPHFKFRVIGDALFSSREYERTVRSLGADCGVEFHGWTGDVAGALHQLDILAVPSGAQEASTRVAMEAMSAGTCVIAYPSGGLPELIRSGYSGLLTDRPDPEALARAIQFLAGDSERRARLAHNGRAEWQARFTVERFQREVCLRLEAAANGPARAASAVRSTSATARPARDATPAWPETPLPQHGASAAAASPATARARPRYTD